MCIRDRRGLSESDEVSHLKGSAAMVGLLAKAVADRQRQPTQDLIAWYGSDRVTLGVDRLNECFAAARRSAGHNDGADRFRIEVIEALAEKVYNRSFNNYADAYRTFARSPSLQVFLLKHWPTLTPEQALNDLLGSWSLLRLAAVGTSLTKADLRSMHLSLIHI